MSPVIRPAPIVKSFVVRATAQRAFDVFTARFDAWWPRTHKLGDGEMRRVALEPGAGGRWYQTNIDGVECDWGEVLAWEPPRRLLLAWRINADFRFDPALLTEIEVLFTPLGEGRTQVDFEHRLLENLGDEGGALRERLDGGWAPILEAYVTMFAPQNEGEPDG